MNFKDLPYKRPNLEKILEELDNLTNKFKKATNLDDTFIQFKAIDKIKSNFLTLGSLIYIRHTIDTRDEFYDKEREFFDNSEPLFNEKIKHFNDELIKSPFRTELEDKLGKQIFSLAEMQIKTFSPEIIEDLQQENKLIAEYDKLLASAQIEFDGKVLNLSGIDTYAQNRDRTIRESAVRTKYSYFSENKDQLNRIYDDLIKVRDDIANKLGYKDYIELGYLKLSRSDFDAKMVKKYRDAIVQYIVPIAEKLYKRQWKRLGLTDAKFWDKEYIFPTGNPTPKGDKDWMVEQAKTMYNQLSPETAEFFNFMSDSKLFDLETKDGKAGGGYCTALPDYNAPYIFSNFNGTSADVDVLTHEAGHAFQVYNSFDLGNVDYLWPTMESCEVHSMSMEFFAWPWMELFFKEDTEKYYFSHLSSAITFLPYGAMVDEFQHMVYENPEATPEERDGFWKTCQKKYYPSIDFGGITYLENGSLWQRQNHIYTMPFYYIDYTLAQVCALQYWVKDRENHKDAWDSYLKLCKLGGKYSFVKLLEEAGIDNPFSDGTIEDVATVIDSYLSSIDDSKF